MARLTLAHCGVKYSVTADEPLEFMAAWLADEMLGLMGL